MLNGPEKRNAAEDHHGRGESNATRRLRAGHYGERRKGEEHHLR